MYNCYTDKVTAWGWYIWPIVNVYGLPGYWHTWWSQLRLVVWPEVRCKITIWGWYVMTWGLRRRKQHTWVTHTLIYSLLLKSLRHWNSVNETFKWYLTIPAVILSDFNHPHTQAEHSTKEIMWVLTLWQTKIAWELMTLKLWKCL